MVHIHQPKGLIAKAGAECYIFTMKQAPFADLPPTSSGVRPAWFLVLLFLPLGLTLWYSSAAFRFGTPGFHLDKTQQGLHISRVFVSLNPVRSGDFIVAINGLPYKKILGFLVLDQTASNFHPSLTINRNGQALQIIPSLIPMTWPLYLRVAWPHLLLIVLFLCLGTLALLRAGPEQPARIFFFMLCGFACSIASTLPSHFGLLDPAITCASFFSICLSNWLAFGGFAHFTSRFPVERDLCRLHSFPAAAFYLLPALVAVGLALGRSGWSPDFFPALQRTRNITLPFIIVGTFLKHLTDLGHLRQSLARNQVKLTLVAFVLTFAPYLFLYLLPNLLFDTPLISFRLVLFAAAALPTAYLIALLRFRLFQVDRIISRSLAYLLVISGLTIVYSALLALMTKQIFGPGFLSADLFLVFIIIVALIINPLLNRVQAFIDHYFFRYRPDDQTVLYEFSQKLATTLDFAPLIKLITDELPTTLGLNRAALMILNQNNSKLFPEHLRIGSRPWPDSHLTDLLDRGEPFVYCGDPVQGQELNRELTEIRRAGFDLVLPIRDAKGLSGILLTGSRLDERPFQEHDIRLLATLANQIGTALKNSMHYTSLMDSKEQLEELFAKVVQAEKMAALGEMSATLAHEIKNPLGIIRSSAQYLAEADRAAEIRQEMLHYIIDEVDGLNRVIGNILGLARFKSPVLKSLDMKQEITAICKRWLSSDDHNPEITLFISIARRLPPLLADPGQLGQVLLNLLRNCEEAMPEGGAIRLSVDRDGQEAVLRIEDEGCGIDPEKHEAVFDDFFTTKNNGLGLGLSVCRQIIQAHHGSISLNNRPQGGVLTLVRLPFNPLARQASPATESTVSNDEREDSDS